MRQSISMLLRKVEKILFYSVVFSIPLNLGKHFVLESSYIYGKLIDYVVPTIFLQDILVFLLLLVSAPRLFKSLTQSIKYWESAFLILFFAAILLSIYTAAFPIASWYFFARLVLYTFFCFYIFSQTNLLVEMPALLKIFSFLLLFQSLLGLGQWINRGSIFNNYMVFGEQPYSFSTSGIMRVSFGGITRLPPYGTFRHPNVLAGFLVFCILFILGMRPKKLYLYLPILPGLLCLLLTFSRLGMISLFIGVLSLISSRKFVKPFLISVLLSGLFATIFLVILPQTNTFVFGDKLDFLLENPSIYRRRDLLLIGWELFKSSPFFGVGLNNSLYYMDEYSTVLSLPRFVQPIHNIYLLHLAEAGIFSFLFLFLFFKLLFQKLFLYFQKPGSGKYSRLFLTLLTVFLFSAFFDHYLFTSQQIFLLFCLTIGLALQYNLR